MKDLVTFALGMLIGAALVACKGKQKAAEAESAFLKKTMEGKDSKNE